MLNIYGLSQYIKLMADNKHTIIAGNIVCKDDKILFVQEKKDYAYKTWNLPTGKIEPGESVTDCAIREANEETGLNVTPQYLVGYYTKPGEKDNINGVVGVFIFYSETNEYNLNPDPDEVLDARWIPFDNISSYELRSSHILEAIQDYESGVKYSMDILNHLTEK